MSSQIRKRDISFSSGKNKASLLPSEIHFLKFRKKQAD